MKRKLIKLRINNSKLAAHVSLSLGEGWGEVFSLWGSRSGLKQKYNE
jgi:hypothetical protein